jgi:hypothetical protein
VKLELVVGREAANLGLSGLEACLELIAHGIEIPDV